MTDYPDADEVVDRFCLDLARALAALEGVLTRIASRHSDRAFTAVFPTGSVGFIAKLSQSEKGFWGLTTDKGAELASGEAGHLVLLNGEDTGYFLSGVALKRLMPQFSRTTAGAVRINEGKIKGERRFEDLDELAALLQQRVQPRTA